MDIGLQYQSLRSFIDEILRPRRNDINTIVVTVWACSPLLVCDLFQDFHTARIIVFFQVLNYDSYYEAYKAEGGVACNDLRDRYETRCKQHYKVYVQEVIANKETLTIAFHNYDVTNKRKFPFQLHAKTMTIRYNDDTVEYVQFSWNLDDRNIDSKGLLYKGLPRGLRDWTGALTSAAFWRYVKGVCATSDVGFAVDRLHEWSRPHCNELDNAVANSRRDPDPSVQLIVSLPQHYQGHRSLRVLAHNVLNAYRRNQGYVSRFKVYTTDPEPSRLVILTNYMDERMVSSACGTIGSVFTLPSEYDDPSPYITTAYPKRFQNNTYDVSDKFVYKMTIDRGDIVWLFFCSHNLTPASWKIGAARVPIGAAPDDGGHEEKKGNDSDSEDDSDTESYIGNPQEGKNLEVGLFLFPSQTQPQLPWSDDVQKRLERYYTRDKANRLVSSHHICKHIRRYVPPGPESGSDTDSDEDGGGGDVRPRRSARASSSTVPLFPLNSSEQAPKRFPTARPIQRCHTFPVDAWERYLDRKHCLLNCLLVNTTGITDLLSKLQFREDNFTRYALYDYIFHDVAGGVTWRKGGAYNLKQLFKVFNQQTRNDPWRTDTRTPQIVVNTLVDVFVKWGRCFELFHSAIVLERPAVTRKTMVDYASIYQANVPDPQRQGRPRLFVDPKGVRQTLDSKSPERVDPYDTLSFLIHHMFDAYEVWWTCPAKRHEFWWPVLEVFEVPECQVCRASPAVQSAYATVRALGYDKVTVEYAVLKRESVDNQERLTKRYNGEERGFLSVRGVLDPHKLKLNDKESLLCDGVLVKSNLLQNMAYDVFFVLQDGDEYQYVAIELDDPSHRSRVAQGNSREPLTNRQRASQIHNNDVVKNVVSWFMGIHVIRIATGDDNYNAPALIPGILTECISWITTRKSWSPVYDNIVDLHNEVKNKVQFFANEYPENDTMNAIEIRNPELIDNRLQFKARESPLSVLLDIMDSKMNPNDNIKVFLKRNRVHAMYDEDAPPVVLCNYVDYFALFYNLLNLLRFRQSRKVDPAETFYTIHTVSGVGTLYDSWEHGGTHLRTRNTTTGKVCSVDVNYLYCYEKEEAIAATRRWTSVRDGAGIVRVMNHFQQPTDTQKNAFHPQAYDREDAVDGLKKGDKVWLAATIDPNNYNGKPVTIRHVRVVDGLVYLDTDGGTVEPWYIRHLIYNLTRQGTRGSRRSSYLPIPDPTIASESPPMPTPERLPRRSQTQSQSQSQLERTPQRSASSRRPLSTPPTVPPPLTRSQRREPRFRVGSYVRVDPEGGGAPFTAELTRVVNDARLADNFVEYRSQGSQRSQRVYVNTKEYRSLTPL